MRTFVYCQDCEAFHSKPCFEPERFVVNAFALGAIAALVFLVWAC